MKIGTKSLLFGAHQFLIHPFFVAVAWFKLYGIPYDPRLWIAFIIHDWGYWGCPNMDGEAGEEHPKLAADLMYNWFGEKWGKFCFFHSRTLSSQVSDEPSKLCWADKLAMALEPWWFYLVRVRLSGELKEYMELSETKFKADPVSNKSPVIWVKELQKFHDYNSYQNRNISINPCFPSGSVLTYKQGIRLMK